MEVELGVDRVDLAFHFMWFGQMIRVKHIRKLVIMGEEEIYHCELADGSPLQLRFDLETNKASVVV